MLITPVGKSLSDPALAEFTKYARERWNIEVKTSALSAGTPIAYGRIVEWNGRPQAHLFDGEEHKQCGDHDTHPEASLSKSARSPPQKMSACGLPFHSTIWP